MTREYIIRLPWPDKMLSPNTRNGNKWLRKLSYAAKKAARNEAWGLAVEMGAHLGDWQFGADLHFDFHPPDRRRRDVQNMPHMLKPAIDGIADALGCDDSLFRIYWPPELDEPVGGGAVLVRVVPRVVG